MGGKNSKEKPKKNEIGNVKDKVTNLSPKDILEIQVSWQEMHKSPLVDPDILLFKLFFEQCYSGREKYSKLIGNINIENMNWINNWDQSAPKLHQSMKKTADALEDFTSSLNYSDRVINTMYEQGLSHAQYGVTSEEIRIFTHCLELTLKMELGLKLTKQGLQAWNTALKLLNRAFCEGLEKGNRKTMKIIKRQAAKN